MIKNRNFVASKPMKKKAFVKILLFTLTLFSFGCFLPIFSTSQNQVAAQTSAVSQGTWGGATWTLNNGNLTLSGGNIGSSQVSLNANLTSAGIDPSTITSITIANSMSSSNTAEAFANFSNLQTITGMKNLSYSGDASYMFLFDSKLSSLDLTAFDTSNITNMYGMFDGDSGLTSLDVSHFNTSKVTGMSYMFIGMSAVKVLDVSNFNTSNVKSMYAMFDEDSGLTSLDVSHFDTSKVTDMTYLFWGDSSLRTLDLSSFSITTNTYTSGMLTLTNNLSQLTLGTKSQLKSDMGLPSITISSDYTGR